MKIPLLASLAVLLIQAGVNPLQQQKPTGSIEGTITRAGSSRPLANARVAVSRRAPSPALPAGVNANVTAAGARGGPAPASIPPATTDDKGKFVVSGLEDGAYNVQVVANGYVAQPYGQRVPSGPGSPVNVSGGQPTKEINVALMPASNVSGRVSDTSGQPLINVQVQLLRYTYDLYGQRTYQSSGSAFTDDRGEYRMYWVTPGRYYMLAGTPSSGSNPFEALMGSDLARNRANGNEVPSVPGYAFYPGVQEIANARTIDLQPGADLQSLDLALAAKPRMFKVRGTVVDSRTGQPPPRANVFVAPQMPGLNRDAFIGTDVPNQNYNGKTGIFEIREILPGTYTLVAIVVDAPVPGRPGPPGQSSATVPLSIGSSDVDGVTIPVVPAATIPGRVRIDGQGPAQLAIDRLRIRLIPVGVSASAQSLPNLIDNVSVPNSNGERRCRRHVPVTEHYSGRLSNRHHRIPHEYWPGGTQFFGSMQVSNAYIKDARMDGVDVLNSPLHFSGSVNNELEIAVGFGSGRIEGTVTDARLQPVVGGRVVAVPERARFQRTFTGRSRSIRADDFVLPQIPPGDYKVFAWESVEDNGWFDPDLLSRSEGRARSVRVSASSTETVSVQITPAETSR